jgi:signal transduction histidine kinase
MNLKRIFASLTFRFMFSYVVGLSLAVFFVLALLFASYSYNYFSVVNQAVKDESARLLQLYGTGGRAALDAAFAQPQTGRTEQHFLYLLTDAQRNRQAGTLNAWPADNYQSWGALEYGVSFRDVNDTGEQMVTHVEALDNDQLLMVARNYSDFILFEHIILNVLVRSMFVTIFMGAIGGAVVAGRGLRNVDTINRTVQSIMQGDLSERISVKDSRGDFRNLAVTVNRMLDRIQTLMEGLRQVSDNIAHDLRTPLTRLRNHLASLQGVVNGEAQHIVQALLEEADSLLATFNALLRIAQVESGNRQSGFQPLDIAVILRDVIELYEPLAAEKDIEISADLRAPLPLSGDRDLLFQAFANLLDNAIKYTPENGAIRVRAGATNTELWVEVADSGWGIPLADRDKVFRRFYRVEASRSQQPGNGLGLSLVQAVVNLHAGSIALTENHPGLKVAVRLPAAA